jgi:hypothetical protein
VNYINLRGETDVEIQYAAGLELMAGEMVALRLGYLLDRVIGAQYISTGLGIVAPRVGLDVWHPPSERRSPLLGPDYACGRGGRRCKVNLLEIPAGGSEQAVEYSFRSLKDIDLWPRKMREKVG